MKEITKEIHKAALSEFYPLIEEMAQSGASKGDIVNAFNKHIQIKTRQFYKGKKDFYTFKEAWQAADVEKNADSKAEIVFTQMLLSEGLSFKFQYPIGNYRADYLFGKDLVVELDGPQHEKKRDEVRDKYLKKMGYRTLRIPLWLLVQDPKAAIATIKELTT
jgi:very-short-patch-repair endonuclease